MKRRSSLDRLLDGLLRDPHDYRPTTNLFPDLDPKKVAQALELDARGRQRALHPVTATDGQLDDVEMQIIEHVSSAQRTSHQILQDELQSYAEGLGGLHFQERVAAIHHTAPDCMADFAAEMADASNRLHEKRRDLLEHENEHNAFRQKHRLTHRLARTHSRAVTSLKWGVLVLLVLVESALNGAFLRKGSQMGWIGGISEAIAFAALNVGGSLAFAALGARWLTHRNYGLKLVGALAVAAWFCFAVLLNLALAHYREVSGNLSSEVSRAVIARLQEAPFALAEVQSWTLFGIGMLFAIAAFVDSLLLFDPYVGYGGVDKRLRKVRRSYRQAHAEVVDQLHVIYADYSEKLAQIGQDLAMRLGEHDRIIEARRGRIELFHAHQSQLEAAANTLLRIYRSASGIPAGKLHNLRHIGVAIESPSLKPAEIQEIVADALQVLRKQTQDLQKALIEGIQEHARLDALVAKTDPHAAS